MIEQKHLKPKQHYIDLYDRHTVEECRRWESEDRLDDLPLKRETNPQKQKIKKKFIANAVVPVALYFITGERYANKEKTIREWMERDAAKDELYESAQAPEGIRCLKCNSSMSATYKDLWTRLDNPDRVLFMYDCPNSCLPRRAFFHDGEEWQKSSHICPQCKEGTLVFKDKGTPTKFITKETCTSCDYTAIQEIERMATKKQKPDKNFEKDRARFCLTEKEGQEYIGMEEKLKQLKHVTDKFEEQEKHKDVYEKARNLKKLTIVQVQKFLAFALEKHGYVNLSFKEPELGREVKVEFTTQESKESRHEYDSRMQLKKLIEKTLVDSTWRLMSEGISYRLGILSGRLRAYEREEDLLKLVNKNHS